MKPMSSSAHDEQSPAERVLRKLRDRLRDLRLDSLDALRVEEEIREGLDMLGRELMSELFARADVDDQEVKINGVLHGRVDRHRAKIHTSFGVVEVDRSVYRHSRHGPTVAPLDKIVGIVEGFYTPKCAKILCRLSALLVRDDMEAVAHDFGGLGVGSATMHRLPQAVMARYEERRDLVERTVRDRSVVPPGAVTMQIGLDGVMVPQEGEHCRPRGRTTNDDPAPPRHELKYGDATDVGPAANDHSAGRAWHEASVATLTFYDVEGTHLATTYIGRMPEEGKASLATMLEEEALHALASRPDLTPVLASDGAPFQWKLLEAMRRRMPEPAQQNACELLDFFHAAENLQEACDAIDGEGTAAASVRRAGWAETLKAYDDGVVRVLQALRYQRRIATRPFVRKEIDKVIGYLRNNQHRMAYRQAIARCLPIGTGATEAAAKSLVGVRMKRSGARFSQHGGQTILSLLAAHKSDRFDDLMNVLGSTYKATVKRAA